MKKVIISSIFAVALLTTAGFGVNKSMKSDANLSDLTLINIEALAEGESGGENVCYDTVTTKAGVQTRYCGTCEFINNSTPSFWAGSKKC